MRKRASAANQQGAAPNGQTKPFSRSSTPPPRQQADKLLAHQLTSDEPIKGCGDAGGSVLRFRCAKDVLARFFFVGIFVTENVMHAVHFEAEVDGMVAPALAPLPREVAVCLHFVHIIFGMFGALFVLVSGFDSAGRTAMTKGSSMMLVFMTTITWTWWINRHGKAYWDLEPYPFWDVRCSAEKRNRTVHILKNISIVGALTMCQQIAKQEASERTEEPPSFLEGLVTALRPWSLTATLAPQFVVLATLRCYMGIALPTYAATFALVLAIMSVQVAANLVNSYRDFERGVDRKETAGDRTLVDNLISVCLLKAMGGLFFVLWTLFYAWSVVATGFHPAVVGLGVLGSFLAVGYTLGPAPLKYLGLGDLAVFLAFGPAVVAFSSACLVGAVHTEAILFSLPVTLFVVATLHANNHRDLAEDRRAGLRTVAGLLGPDASRVYYAMLLGGAHILALCLGWQYNVPGCLATLAALPQSAWLIVRIRRPETLRNQDEETAKSTLMFAVALALGVAILPRGAPTALGLGVPALVVAVLKLFAD